MTHSGHDYHSKEGHDHQPSQQRHLATRQRSGHARMQSQAVVHQLHNTLHRSGRIYIRWHVSREGNDPENVGTTGRLTLVSVNTEQRSFHSTVSSEPRQSGTTQPKLDIAEPQTYHQAMKGPHSESWSRSMDNEHNSLLENETWTLVRTEDMEPNHTALSGKWVYKLKRDVNGNITRYKSRWVVKGYLQQYGVDFEQTCASVVKPMAFRLLFAIAAHHDLDIEQLDVVTAFLYGVIDQLIYVQMPKGYEKAGMICKLNKALYGLKQSPRLWYERLSEFLLTKLGLSKLHADHSIFSSSAGIRGPIGTSFVDDLNIIGPKGSPMISEVKKQLNIAFKMVDMGSTTPMKEGSLFRNESQASESDIKQYQAIVGSIMFAMIETRPDTAYATSVVSRHAKNPGKSHMEAAKQILRYLSATRDRGITFGGGDLSIQGYSDSDWAGD